MIVWPVKFMMMIYAFNADKTMIDFRLFEEEYVSMDHCLDNKPKNQITRDGVILIFECIRKQGA